MKKQITPESIEAEKQEMLKLLMKDAIDLATAQAVVNANKKREGTNNA